MRINSIGIGAALSALLFAVPVFAKQVVYQTFNDWVVACDNTGRCEASGASEAGSGMLTLVREAGVNGAISLTLQTPKPVDHTRLRADKKNLQIDLSQWKANGAEDAYTLTNTDFNAIANVLGQMRYASRLSFGGAEDDAVSLAGLSAALLLVDERQGRIETPRAVLRRGAKEMGAVPDAEPVPEIRAAALLQRELDPLTQKTLMTQVRQTQKALLKSEDCSKGTDMADSAALLDEQSALVLIECLRGAYQSSSLVFKVPLGQPKQAQRIILDIPLGNKAVGADRDMVTMGDFSQGLLTHAARGRGMADCGESAAWVWDGQTFVLAAFSFMDSCRGGQPGQWPVLWRTTVVR